MPSSKDRMLTQHCWSSDTTSTSMHPMTPWGTTTNHQTSLGWISHIRTRAHIYVPCTFITINYMEIISKPSTQFYKLSYLRTYYTHWVPCLCTHGRRPYKNHKTSTWSNQSGGGSGAIPSGCIVSASTTRSIRHTSSTDAKELRAARTLRLEAFRCQSIRT